MRFQSFGFSSIIFHWIPLQSARAQYDTSWAKNGTILIANDYDRFYLLEEGEAWVYAPGLEIHLVPGYFYLIPGGPQLRRYRCPSTMILNWVHFKVEIVTGISLFNFYTPPIKVPSSPQSKEMLDRLIVLMQRERTPREWNQIQRLLSALVEPFFPEQWDQLFPPHLHFSRFIYLLRYIEDHLDEPFCLKRLAEVIGLHPIYLSRVFKNTFSQSLRDYYNYLKIQRAQILLYNPMLTIKEIANQCGYQDALYFSRIFRKRCGVSPTRYRKLINVMMP